MKNGFTHYYKMRVYVDDGHHRYETYKYVFADNENKAREAIFKHYDSQYDTYVRIIEMYDCPVQDVMMFNEFTN